MISSPFTHFRKSVKKTFHFIKNTALRITIHASYSHSTTLLVHKNTHRLIKTLIGDRLNVTNWSWRIRGTPRLPGATGVDREVWNYVLKCPNVDFCITRLSSRKKNGKNLPCITMEKTNNGKKTTPQIAMQIFMHTELENHKLY